MQLNPAEISGFIQEKIADYDNKVESKAEGTIISLYDGVARIQGLRQAMLGEMIAFPGGVYGLRSTWNAIAWASLSSANMTTSLKATKSPVPDASSKCRSGANCWVVLSMPSDSPLTARADIKTSESSPIEKSPPALSNAKSVDQPLQTGLKSIDSMVPIGRGQRELIIGDRQTGKTAIAVGCHH